MQALNDTIEGNDSLRKIKEWVMGNPIRAAIVAVVAIAVIIAIIVIIVLAAGNKGSTMPATPGNSTMSPSVYHGNLTRSPEFASHTSSPSVGSNYSLPSYSNRTSMTISPTFIPVQSPSTYNTSSNSSSTSNSSSSSSNYWIHDYSTPCNGRGLLFPDSGGICECFLNCWTGASCQYNSTNCTLYAKNEEAVGVFEDYWVSRSNNFPAPYIPFEYRLPYQADLRILSPSSPNGLSRNLYSAIKYLHTVVGNANITGRSIILGSGRISLMQAALASLYRLSNNQSVTLYSRVPHNRDYPRICTYSQHLCDFTNNAASITNNSLVFELVTVPNIPTGRTDSNFTTPTFPTNKYWGIDANDNWPTWTPSSANNSTTSNATTTTTTPTTPTIAISAPIMFFSSSKSHGHEAGRFAWALIDTNAVPGLIEGMRDYISTLYVHPSVDSMYRELSILNNLNLTGLLLLNQSSTTTPTPTPTPSTPSSVEIWNMTSMVVKNRWSQIQSMFTNPSVISQGWSVDSAYGSCYLWIRCPSFMSGSQCQIAFESKGLVGYPGSDFGVVSSTTSSSSSSPAYYRLSISVRSAVWEVYTQLLAQVLGI